MCLQTPDPEADRNVTASLTLGQGKSAPHSSYRTLSDGFGHGWNLPVLVFLESSFSRESVWVLSWLQAQERGLAYSLARAHSPARYSCQAHQGPPLSIQAGTLQYCAECPRAVGCDQLCLEEQCSKQKLPRGYA